jgi:hypothetical protein
MYHLDGRRGLAVRAGGKVYSAGPVGRRGVIVEPLWVALLTPAEG